MPFRIATPYAPAYLHGLGSSAPAGAAYEDQSFDIVVNQVLTANQSNLQLYQPIERDADFVWRGIIANSSTGLYQVRFDVNGWYMLSNAQVLSTNIPSDPANPFPLFPELTVPAGGRIGILLSDLSGATNTLQLILRGVKRFTAASQRAGT